MPQHDKRIPENARCSICSGSGWTSWTAPETEEGLLEQAKWIICRECLGTGRTDKKGRKRQKPDDPSDG
jgi:DnaJ-class molecular chaperone